MPDPIAGGLRLRRAGDPYPSHRSTTLRWRIAAALTVVLIGATACTRGELDRGEAAVVQGGHLEVAVGDGWQRLAESERVVDGATVRTRGEEASLSFRDAVVRLAPRSELIVSSRGGEVIAGEALVDGALDMDVAGVLVRGDGVHRVSLRPSPQLRVYSGTARALATDHERAVAALRQLDLDGRRLPIAPAPLQYLASDAWDAELLAPAIAFDAEAARTLTGLSMLVGGGPKPRSFFARYLERPMLALLRQAATRVEGTRFGPAGDVLLALALVSAADAPSRESLSEVSSLRAQGARWGLIAMELGVNSSAVVAVLDARQGRRVALADRTQPEVVFAGSGVGASDAADGSDDVVADGGSSVAAGGGGGGTRDSGSSSGGSTVGSGSDGRVIDDGGGAPSPPDRTPPGPPKGGDDGDGDGGDGGGDDDDGDGGGGGTPMSTPTTGVQTVDDVVREVTETVSESTSALQPTIDDLLGGGSGDD